MNIKRIQILLKKELLDFYSSKAWMIALFLPLFITFLFATIYSEKSTEPFKIGVIGKIDPAVGKFLSGSDFKRFFYSSLPQAKNDLGKKALDGILFSSPETDFSFTLLTSGTAIPKASLIVNAFNTSLVKTYSKEKIPQVNLAVSDGARKISSLALPLWLIQIILTGCLLQNSATIAEEKAKHTLHSLLVSPMTLLDYFASKILWNSGLGVILIILTAILTRFPYNPFYLIGFSFLGCFVYSCFALLIGLLTPNALLARTSSTAFYLISALPLMFQNTNLTWKNVLNIFPTFSILQGLEKAFFQSPLELSSGIYMSILLIEALIILWITYFNLKDHIEF